MEKFPRRRLGRTQRAAKQSARKPGAKTAVPKAPKPVAEEREAQEPKRSTRSRRRSTITSTRCWLCAETLQSGLSRVPVVRRACIKALEETPKGALSELIELAKPAPRRGRPAEGARVMSACLAAALDYAAKRLPVFPCVPNGKLPAIARGFYAATTNPETIKRYWRAPDRNIGIPTGSVSGFWVLDIDGDNGEANLFALEAKHGRLPPTREVITGGGGRHLWFKYTGPIQSSVSKIAPGIDMRG